MKVILRDDVDGLGRKGDICVVSDGYARNYLVPRGLAMKSSKGATAQAEAMRRSAALRTAADKDDAEAIAARLESAVITITANAADTGHLYGSVSAADIVEAVQAQTGAVLDRRVIDLDSPIKDVGSHSVSVKPHPEVEFALLVEVGAE